MTAPHEMAARNSAGEKPSAGITCAAVSAPTVSTPTCPCATEVNAR